MTNQPDHLRPWSTIDDEELKAYRALRKALGAALSNGMLRWNPDARISTREYNWIREEFDAALEALTKAKQ